MVVACDLCKKTFRSRSLVNRHKRQVHKLNPEKLARGRPRGTAFTCPVCNWSTANRRLLIHHQHSKHENNRYKIEVHCPVESCNYWFLTRQELCNHVLFMHTDEIPEGSSISEMYFSNMEEFKEWKEHKEAETGTKYILTRAPKAQKTGIVYRYFCHRSGVYVGKGRGIRHLQLKGTCKIGRTCPAMISAQNRELLVHVVFNDVHYGHCNKIVNTHMSKGEQEQIAKRLSQNIPFETILKNVRDSLDYEQTNGSFILQGHAMSSVMSDFDLDVDKSTESGVESVMVWAKELAGMDYETVRYVKSQGAADEIHGLKEEDSVLVIMTDIQKGMLLKFGKNRFICIDRICAYNSCVTTMVVVDDYNEGFPVAFCFSNSDAYSVLKCFINVVKISVEGVIPVKFLMTDDDSVYDTWVDVMGFPDNRLLCSWHVDKMWRKNISSNLTANNDLKIRIYKALIMLLHCEDVHKFYLELDDFLSLCENIDSIKDFGKYFHKQYVVRCEQWAYCYRVGLCINPSRHIEVFHKVLKQIVTSGLKLGRVDKSVNALMAILRPRVLFRRLMKLSNEKLARAVQQINERHAESLALDLEAMIIDGDCWKVHSSKNESYRIKREAVASNHVNCKLKCIDCDICFHDFSCTCSDYSLQCTICKHIHLIIRIYTIVPPLVGSEVEINGQTSCEFEDYIDTECVGPINSEFESRSVESYCSNRSSELGEIDNMINQLKAKMQDTSIINNPASVSHIHQSLSTLLSSLDSSKQD